MQTKQTESGTQAIQRALSILNCFARKVDFLSLTEISKLVGIPYSTTSRIVGILEQESFLIRDRHTKRYSLGRRIYGLGYCAKQSDFLRKVIYSYLQKLRDEFEETAVIYVREDDYRVCLEKVSAFHSFKFSPAIGSRYVLWAGAGGRGFLAYASPQEQDSFITNSRNLTTFTNIDKKSIMKELYNLCKNGYAYCVNEYQEGFSSISGPIIDNDNNLLCTIAVTGPTSRFTSSMINALKIRIPEYCLEISSTFGWDTETNQTNYLFPSPSLNHIMQYLN